MIRYATAVLAGGRGERIGGGKPLRRLGDWTLLDHALARATSWPAPVVLVVREGQQGLPANISMIVDDPVAPGPLGGLAAALGWAMESGLEAVLTLPCDMPFLPDDLPSRLAAGLAPEGGMAMATSGGRRHPICGLWRCSVIEALNARAIEGRYSLHGLADQVGCAEVDWPGGDQDPFFNINTTEDLRLAARRLNASD